MRHCHGKREDKRWQASRSHKVILCCTPVPYSTYDEYKEEWDEIDRIIFLRICEDRGIEGDNQLMALQNGSQMYPRLCEIFRNADDRYNSGLFHFWG